MKIRSILSASSLMLVVSTAAWAENPPAKGTPPGTPSTGMPNSGTSGRTTLSAEPMPKNSAETLCKVHGINLMEVDLGQLAALQGSTHDVRKYGEMLMTQHLDADKRVRATATDLKIALIAQKAKKTAEEKAAHEEKVQAAGRLANMTGRDFDRDFLKMMDTEHGKAIEMLTAVRPNIQDKPVLQLIDKMLPSLREHQNKARDLLQKLPTSADG